MRIFLALVLALLWHTTPAFAIATNVANTLSSCGTAGYAPNHDAPLTVNLLGELCINGSGGGGGGTSSNFGDPFPTAGTAAGFKNPSNNMAPATLNADGGLEVHLLNGGSGGTSSTFGATFPTLGTASGFIDGSGNMAAAKVDGSGNQLVTCSNCSGSGASAPDESSFTAGTSPFAPSGGFYQTTSTSNPLTNGQQGMAQMTAQRALFSNLRNASGTEIGTSSNPIRIDPTGSTTQPISGTVTANAGTGTFTVGGTVAATQSGNWTTRIVGNSGTTLDGTAGSPSTGVLTIQGVTSGTPVSVAQSPPTSGGLSVSRAVLANSTNATVVKNGAGQLYSISAFGISAATPAWIKFYNTSSSPTCNSSTVVAGPFLIPANTLGAGLAWNNTLGLAFSTGISYCVTTGIADNDNTAVAASTYTVTIGYK